MAPEALSIKAESQVEFFMPIIEAYTAKLIQAFSQSKNKDYSEAVWQIILEDGNMGKFLNQHLLFNCWEDMARFLKRESKLYGFIEEKQSGLTEMDYKIWLFFSPNIANDFFKNQIDRPKSFNTANIISLPYIKLLEPFTEKMERVLQDTSLGVADKMDSLLKILNIAEWFLNESDFTIFDVHFKKSIVNVSLLETGALIKVIKNSSAFSPKLGKRLNCLFKIVFRYFRAKNELETRYFRKLLLEDPFEIEKGLKLTYKKVADFKKTLQ